MKLGSVCYLPPPNIGTPEIFLENLKKFPSKHPVYLCSDYTRKRPPFPIAHCASPECVRRSESADAVQKFAFLNAATLAQENGLDYFIILEDDCRVGEPGWDDRIFTEFFEKSKDGLNGGTVMSWYPEWTPKFRSMWAKHLAVQRKAGHPGVLIINKDAPPYPEARRAYANGAVSIIKTALISPIFDKPDLYHVGRGTAWDDSIGRWLWKTFGDESYDRIVPLESVMSDCVDHGSTLEQRQEWLTSHKVAAIHQVKTEWTP